MPDSTINDVIISEDTTLDITLNHPGAIFAPPTNVQVEDIPYDNGHSLKLSWSLSTDDNSLTHYYIFRSRSSELSKTTTDIESFTSVDDLIVAEENTTILVAKVLQGTNTYTDKSVPLNGANYYYWIQSVADSGSSSKIPAGKKTSVKSEPTNFTLSAPYPNPFNASVTLEYVIANVSFVTLRFYDILGREVAVLQNGVLNAGLYRAIWDGKDNFGMMLGSGVYIYRIKAGGQTVQGKVMLLR